MARLELSLRAQEDFISVAVHDLTTRVTGLLLQVELMEQDAPGAPSAPADHERLGTVVRQTQELARLVERVLAAARLTQEEAGAGPAASDIGAVARRVRGKLGAVDKTLVVDVDPAVAGTVPEAHIEQLLENLLANAVQYSPAQRARRARGEVRIDVSDQGMGIFPDDLDRIFGRYERGRHVDPRRFLGTGLGLFICRKTVEGLGGRIWAESEGVGAGAVFHLVLPTRASGCPPPEGGTRRRVSRKAPKTAGRTEGQAGGRAWVESWLWRMTPSSRTASGACSSGRATAS